VIDTTEAELHDDQKQVAGSQVDAQVADRVGFGSLSQGLGFVFSAHPTRNMALAIVSNTGADIILAVCYEDMSHSTRPEVAIPRCLLLRVQGMMLTKASDLFRVTIPSNTFISSANLDPDNELPSAAKASRYVFAMAPLSESRVLLCFIVIATCAKCQGRVCETLEIRAGQLHTFYERPHLLGSFLGSSSLVIAPLGGVRALLCYSEKTASDTLTTCELLKALGNTLFSRDRLAMGRGELADMSISKHGEYGTFLCQKPLGTFEVGFCDVIRYSKSALDNLETITEGTHVEVSPGRASAFVVAHIEVSERVKRTAAQQLVVEEVILDETRVSKSLVWGLFITLIILAIIRACFKSTWLCAYWIGLDPPPQPEVEVLAKIVAVQAVHTVEVLSPRIAAGARRLGEMSPRALRQISNRLGDISPRHLKSINWSDLGDDWRERLNEKIENLRSPSPGSWKGMGIGNRGLMLSPRRWRGAQSSAPTDMSPRINDEPRMPAINPGNVAIAVSGLSSDGSAVRGSMSLGQRASAAVASNYVGNRLQAREAEDSDDDDDSSTNRTGSKGSIRKHSKLSVSQSADSQDSQDDSDDDSDSSGFERDMQRTGSHLSSGHAEFSRM